MDEELKLLAFLLLDNGCVIACINWIAGYYQLFFELVLNPLEIFLYLSFIIKGLL